MEYITDVQKASLKSLLNIKGVNYKSLVKKAFAAHGLVKEHVPIINSLTYQEAVYIIKYANDRLRENNERSIDMKSLLPGEIKGYIVRKVASELKVGDIIFVGNIVDIVEKVEESSKCISIVSGKTAMSSDRKVFFNCIQKEDPAIQIAIEEKLEVLRKHKVISKSSNNHEVLRNGDRLTTSGEWIKQGRPHQWLIIETEGEYEYWEDSAHEMKVLWAGNKIIAWNDCKKKPLSMYMLSSKEGVCVFDAPTYGLPKYIWR